MSLSSAFSHSVSLKVIYLLESISVNAYGTRSLEIVAAFEEITFIFLDSAGSVNVMKRCAKIDILRYVHVRTCGST